MKPRSRTKPYAPLVPAIFGLLTILFLIATTPVYADEASEVTTSAQGIFKVSYSPSSTPVPLNEIHQWSLHIMTANGSPVDDALVSIKGGMPAHNHGLPTAPEITRAPGRGNYLVQGIRFHMPGEWLITLSIETASIKDTAEINLNL